MIEVADNGIGMSALEARRAFEPFYRADSDLGGRAAGVGLGLAIARHLVQRHGGTINVRSRAGEGTAFSIRLPGADEGND